MSKNSQPEVCICDIIAYTPKTEGYPIMSDMNKLAEMVHKQIGGLKWQN